MKKTKQNLKRNHSFECHRFSPLDSFYRLVQKKATIFFCKSSNLNQFDLFFNEVSKHIYIYIYIYNDMDSMRAKKQNMLFPI